MTLSTKILSNAFFPSNPNRMRKYLHIISIPILYYTVSLRSIDTCTPRTQQQCTPNTIEPLLRSHDIVSHQMATQPHHPIPPYTARRKKAYLFRHAESAAACQTLFFFVCVCPLRCVSHQNHIHTALERTASIHHYTTRSPKRSSTPNQSASIRLRVRIVFVPSPI